MFSRRDFLRGAALSMPSLMAEGKRLIQSSERIEQRTEMIKRGFGVAMERADQELAEKWDKDKY